MSKETLDSIGACKYLNISDASLTELIVSGKIPGAKIAQQWVFFKDDLAEYLAEQVRIQTAERREAFNNGVRKIQVDTAVSRFRENKRKRKLPELPPVPEQKAA